MAAGIPEWRIWTMVERGQGVRWDLGGFFPEFNGSKMRVFKNRLAADAARLQKEAARLAPLSAKTAGRWEKLILAAEDLDARIGHLGSYVACLEAADAKNEAYSAEKARLSELGAQYAKLDVDLLRAFKDAPDAVFAAFLKRKPLAPIAYSLGRLRERARRTMSSDEEKLAADLCVDGFHSWGRLYDKVSGGLEFEMHWPDGRRETLPISRWRSLMSDADREVGRAAFEGGNRTWAGVQDVCAAALNAIAGFRLTLNRHRGIPHFLDRPLFAAGTSRKTLDAMYAAIQKNLPLAREIFRVKARSLGRKGIRFFEREAPLALKDSSRFTWEQGSGLVAQSFATAYPRLGEYYRQFLRDRWLESESRGGKRPGAFCTGSSVSNEQRVYMAFNGSLRDVETIAHEIGHAWHGHLLRDLRHWGREYPMTLAETASIFGEQILADGIYEDQRVGERQKLLMLDAELCGAAVMLLDITVRFEFEKAFHEERMKGEVSVSRLRELMVQTQRRVFGDALEPGGEDPLFWVSKLHFYITDVSFYNFPYTFGFLLAKALFTRFKAEGPAFLPKYEAFLRLTGSGTVEEVAHRSIGADVGNPAFWETSIRSLAAPLERYKKLLSAIPAGV
ncbi:MAG: hypothetical protein A2X36_02595 [Elusimicrobia bacterium GWA2_69_24]|nr:MAG: hypothetical protein A2X36_02595 [Elusimicrobia bacterium GWA2_69_24]